MHARWLASLVAVAPLITYSPMCKAKSEAKLDELKPGENIEETYELNRLGLIHVEGERGWLDFGSRTWWRPSRGKYRESMTYRDFYLAAGRPDLAEQQSSRDSTSSALFWGGALGAIGGIIVFFYGLDQERPVIMIAGGGLFAGGLAAASIGGSMSRPVISEEAAGQLAEQYNHSLAQHLNVSPPGKSSSVARRGPRIATLGVMGLSVSASF